MDETIPSCHAETRRRATCRAARRAISAYAACLGISHDRDFRSDLRPGLNPSDFSVTRDPFLVFTSNIMALLGLRSLYFALAGAVDRFRYLRTALGLLLVLIGTKFLLKDVLVEGPATVFYTLGAVALILAGGIIASVVFGKRAADHSPQSPAQRK
jgi:hypothetical protein